MCMARRISAPAADGGGAAAAGGGREATQRQDRDGSHGDDAGDRDGGAEWAGALDQRERTVTEYARGQRLDALREQLLHAIAGCARSKGDRVGLSQDPE